MLDDVPPEFLNFLRDEHARAQDTYLDQERTNAIQFYNGEPYGDEEDGRSQVVTRDVAETIDHMTVSILRTMISGDRVVEFSGGKGDEDEQSTELVDQVFRQKMHGYRILHDWLKAGLLEKTGVVKTWVEPQPPLHTEHLVHPAMLGEIQNLAAAEPTDPANELDAPWRVKVAHPQAPVIRCATVPNEESFVAYDARDRQTAIYQCHRTPKTISELRDMGFDVPDDLQGTESTVRNNILSNARDSGRGSYWTGEERQGAVRTVWLDEEYVRYDLNGDGYAELLCVHRVGNDILVRSDTGKLAIEEVDEQPFDEWCPFPMPHRRVGQSLADKTMDIQRVNSVLLRNALDSLYFGIAPGTYLSESAEGDHTIDDLLTVRPNRIIRYKGAVPPQPEQRPDTSATAFQAIEFMIGQRESRTGITRLNQGLDADALNKTATGTAMMQAQGQQIEEYVARNFAEAVASLFKRIRKLLREHGEPTKVVINGQEAVVDPRTWSEEIEVHVRVGLGSNRKDQRLIYRQQLLGIQQQAMMGGLPIVGPKQVYNSIKGLITDAALGNVNDFILDPDSPEGQQLAQQAAQRPDPQQQKIEGELQLKAQQNAAAQQHMQDKLQIEAGKVQGHLQLKAAETAGKLQQQGQKHMADVAMTVAKNEAEGHIAIRQQNMDAALAEREMQQNYALEQQRLAHDEQVQHHKIEAQKAVKKDRPGGRLDA